MTRKPKRVSRYVVKECWWFAPIKWGVTDNRDCDEAIVACFKSKVAAKEHANVLNGNGVK